MNELVVIGLIAAVAFAIVVAVGFAFAGGETSQDRALKRAQAMAGPAPTRDAARRARAQAANTPEARRKQIMKSLQDQERRQKKVRLTLANKIHQAGMSFKPVHFWLASGAFGLTIALMAIIGHLNAFVAVALGASCALGVPQWVLGFLAKRRTNKFTLLFSEGMDIIVRGIKSGLPVHDCLKIIARETSEPLSGEFNRLVENIGMGMTLDQSLEKLFARMPTSEVRFFAIVMNIQQKTGGNLAEALNNLSVVLRSRRLMREKVKALSAEATSSAAIIACLPPGVVVLISIQTPSYMMPMLTDHRGWLMLGASAIWMSIGVFVMVRMINFKF